jgi:hypothetical protein
MPNILVGTVSAIALVMGFAVGGCDTFSGSNTPRDTTRSDTNRGGTTGSGIGGTTGGGMEGGRTGSGS